MCGGDLFDKLTANGFKLFCDLDGVLTDIERSFKRLDTRFREIPKSRLWDMVEANGARFWETLAWTYDGKRLWHAIEMLSPTILTAAPDRSANLFATSELGKRRWIQREVGPAFEKQAIVCRRFEKPSFADTGHILIDDFQPTIRDWQAAGGTGILHVSASQTIVELMRLIDRDDFLKTGTDRRSA